MQCSFQCGVLSEYTAFSSPSKTLDQSDSQFAFNIPFTLLKKLLRFCLCVYINLPC